MESTLTCITSSRFIHCLVGLTIFQRVFSYISHIQTECRNHPRILSGILSISRNIGMDLNKFMLDIRCLEMIHR